MFFILKLIYFISILLVALLAVVKCLFFLKRGHCDFPLFGKLKIKMILCGDKTPLFYTKNANFNFCKNGPIFAKAFSKRPKMNSPIP